LFCVRSGCNRTRRPVAGSGGERDRPVFWASEKGALLHCQNAETGKFEYSHRISPDPGLIYASPLLADGKL
jgi:hypothetical protein